MARVYATKGPDAKKARLTIPMTQQMLERLAVLAGEAGKTRTEYARLLIERALKAGSR
jgi:predicted DNA-binding protein